jgi:hypothetical protein
MPPDGCIDIASGGYPARRNGLILPPHATPFDLVPKLLVGKESTGYDKHTRCILVEAMHDPRTWNPGQFRIMVQEGVGKRIVPVSRPGMHNKTSRFVDDYQLLVLVKN